MIPTLDEEAELERLLRSLPRIPRLETIVSDGGSEDDTCAIARAHKVRLINCPLSQRAAQMNAGARIARGDVILFLHADTRIDRRSLRNILGALRDKNVVGGAFQRRFRSSSRILKLTCRMADLRSRLTGIYFGDQAMFARRSVFKAAGGFPGWDEFEDVELGLRLRRYGKTVLLRPAVNSSARRFQRRGILLQTLLDLVHTLRFLLLRRSK